MERSQSMRLLLPEDEYAALLRLCQMDIRPDAHEIRYILRQEMIRRGVLERDTAQQQEPAEGVS